MDYRIFGSPFFKRNMKLVQGQAFTTLVVGAFL